MKIKAKLTLGIGLLFALIFLLAAVGVWNTNALRIDSQNILVDNYNTLEYCRNMLINVDAPPTEQTLSAFKSNLLKQQENITEIGEQHATEDLYNDFLLYVQNSQSVELRKELRSDIYLLLELNMAAIQRKSLIAEATALRATTWIAVTGTLCFLIAFSLFINLPGSVANPLRELTNSIKEIAAKNYKQRVNFEKHNEFGDLARAFNSMAQKLEEYDTSNLASILIEKKRVETLINNMHDPVIGLDEHNLILFMNWEALRISGLKSEDVLGKSAQDIAVHNDLMRSLIKDIVQAPLSEPSSRLPMKIYADQKESYFQKDILDITIIPTGELNQVTIGKVIILKNITPFKELDLAKTNFIATVSHELKTPISSIKLSIKILENAKNEVLSDDQKMLVQSIKEDSNRLLKITGELLNLSQVETGNIQLTLQSGQPGDIVQRAICAIQNQAEQAGVTLIAKVDEHIADIKCDPEKTSWVLINILNNAIHYSYSNGEVHLHVYQMDRLVIFSVKDFGKGIEEKYLHKVFDRYFQVPGSASGTGLGLAICREFIEAQGGQIWLEENSLVGCHFMFSLPVLA